MTEERKRRSSGYLGAESLGITRSKPVALEPPTTNEGQNFKSSEVTEVKKVSKRQNQVTAYLRDGQKEKLAQACIDYVKEFNDVALDQQEIIRDALDNYFEQGLVMSTYRRVYRERRNK